MASVKTIPLFSGESGGLTGDSGIERKKKLAEMLMQTEAAPVWSTGQGLLSAGATMMGGLLAGRAEAQEKKEENDAWAEITRAMTSSSGLGDAPEPFASSSTGSSAPNPLSSGGSTPSGGRSGGGSRALASNERRQRAVARLVERGYSPHAAEGIADNLHAESGFNTHAVGDNGTAFGIAQWRGPRFQNLKKFAASQGKDWKDFDVQVDFVDHEMKTGSDEGARIAYAKLREAPDADTAHDAFVTHYERPSAANLQKRLRGGRGAQVAQAGDDFPMPEFDPTPYQRQAQQGARLMASRNPVLRRQGLMLMQQAQQAALAAQAEHRKLVYEAKRDAYKRRDEREFKREEWDRQDFREERKDIRQHDFKANEPYTLTPGSARFRGSEKIAEVPKSDGADIEVDANGNIRVKTGKLTEQQSKDIGFYDRGASAELELREREDALTDFMSKNAGNIPAIGNYMKSPEYRQAEVAANQFLGAILRKDTGAAVTPQEFTLYGGMFLPQPGDDAETIRLKRQARATALKAIKKGLGPAEALAEAYPGIFDGKSLEPAKKPDQKAEGGKGKTGAAMGGYKIGEVVGDYRYTGGDPTKRENWEKIQWN